METPTFYDLQKQNVRKSIVLIFFFILIAGGIGFLLDYFYFGFPDQNPIPFATIIAISIALLQSLFSYFNGASLVLMSVRARPANPDVHKEKQLLNVIEEMKIASGIPMPKVHIIESPVPNAFATGRDPEHSHVAVTTTLLNMLNREELQGVIAHEMSHIRNRDILTMTVVATLLGVIVLLSEFALRSTYFLGLGGRSRRRRSSRGRGGGGALLIALLLLVVAILAPIVARLMFLAVSRSREYLADATGAEITRNPVSLANALEKLSNNQTGKALGNRGLAHMFVVSPLKSKLADKEHFWSNLWSTHPPIQKRIFYLKRMAHTG